MLILVSQGDRNKLLGNVAGVASATLITVMMVHCPGLTEGACIHASRKKVST